jgi:hypothetical protein
MKRVYEALLQFLFEAFPLRSRHQDTPMRQNYLLKTLPADWKYLDLERRADYEIVSRDPDAFFRLNPRQVALDEAQLTPEIFPALRVSIDRRNSEKGWFVTSGSSSPELLRSVSESLAGRDSLLHRLQDRKAKPMDLIEKLKPRSDVAQAHEFWFRGGGLRDFIHDHKVRLGLVITNNYTVRQFDSIFMPPWGESLKRYFWLAQARRREDRMPPADSSMTWHRLQNSGPTLTQYPQ